MQFVDRGRVAPPQAFRDDAARAEREEFLSYMQESADRRSQTTPPSRRFSIAGEETLSALNELFHGKCAFCESRVPLNANLFRPAEEAEPLARSEFAHLYYAWLRTDWGNVYGVCSSCSMASRNQFPVKQPDRGRLPTYEELRMFANENYGLWRWPHADKRLLLDPCEDRTFVSDLAFSLDGGIQAFTDAGARTIAVFNLDRKELVDSRSMAFQSYVDLLRSELERGVAPNVFDFAGLEYGGGWNLLLRRLVNRIGQRLDQSLRTQPDQVARTVQRIWNTPIGRDALLASLDDVRGPVARATVKRPPAKGQARRLVGVQVGNFKALENLRLDLQPEVPADPDSGREAEASALLILGENAAGKSSILEAIALALTDDRMRQKATRPPESFILDPTLMGSVNRPPPATATVRLDFEGGTDLTLTISDRFVEVGASDNLPPVFAYGAFRQYNARSPSRPPPDHLATLFRSEALLANPEAWLLGLKPDEFAMVVRALQKILVIEGDYEVVNLDPANQRCLIVSRIGDGDDRYEIRTPLKVVSSGFRSVLAMVCDVLAGLMALQRPGDRQSFAELQAVILIDEVEAHLHPRWKMQIMAALRRVLPKATIIATTHDPLCLRGMHDREVVVFNRAPKTDENDNDPGALPMFVETVVELPNVENLTVEQLLTSDFFSMFSTDSPAAEFNLAKLGSLVARQAKGETLTPQEVAAVEELRAKVVDALPLGSSEVQRLVEEAVFTYLEKRRDLQAAQLAALKTQTRDQIVKALEGY